MIVVVNEQPVEVAEQTTVAKLLASLGFPDRGVAVAPVLVEGQVEQRVSHRASRLARLACRSPNAHPVSRVHSAQPHPG